MLPASLAGRTSFECINYDKEEIMKKLLLLSVFTVSIFFTPMMTTNAFAHGDHHRNHDSTQTSVPLSTTTIPTQDLTDTTVPNDTMSTTVPEQSESSPTTNENCVASPPVYTSSGEAPTENVIPGGTVSFDTSCGSGTAQFVYGYQYKSTDVYRKTVHTETRYVDVPRVVTVIDHVPSITLPEIKATQVATPEKSLPRSIGGVSVTAVLTGLGSVLMYGLRKWLVVPFF